VCLLKMRVKRAEALVKAGLMKQDDMVEIQMVATQPLHKYPHVCHSKRLSGSAFPLLVPGWDEQLLFEVRQRR
jgi:hypothetical protein